MKSGFVVYWIDDEWVQTPGYKHFGMTEMTAALQYAEEKRKCGLQYVGIVSQNSDSVGKPGVSDDRPEDYSWSKQHRGDGQPDGPKTMIGGRSNG